MKLNTSKHILKCLRRHIKEANNIVAILGVEMLVESGGVNFDTNDETYRIEQEYGFTPEEILSGGFFCAKQKMFYDFYRKEVLRTSIHSTPGYEALLILQKRNKLKTVINKNYYDVPKEIKFDNLISLSGTVSHNFCPRCKKSFSSEYLISKEGIPYCDSCKASLRPDIRLFGERINNALFTQAVNACTQADLILMLGKDTYHDNLLPNRTESRKQTRILFTSEKYMENPDFDFIIHDEIQEIIPLII